MIPGVGETSPEARLGAGLGTLVLSRRAEILERWKGAARGEIGESLAGSELLDALPRFVEAIGAALVRIEQGGSPDDRAIELATFGREHGRQRSGKGVALDQLTREYDLLRDVMLAMADEAGVVPSLAEYRVLAAAFSSAMAEAIRSFLASREDELRRLQERYFGIAHHAPAAVYVKDASGRFQFVNRHLARLLGRRGRDVVGSTGEELLPPAVAETLRASGERAARGEIVETEIAIEGARGERHFLVVEFAAEVDLDGTPAVVGIGLDVTERRAAEREARRAAELLELGDAFFELDREWRVVRVNRNQERLTRRPRRETLGRVMWELWPELRNPELRSWRELHRVMEHRETREFEEYFEPLDLWSAMTAYPVRGGGIAVFFRDVSRRKRMEREKLESVALLEGILAAAPIGLSFVDPSLRYVRANEALARISGIPLESLIGRTIREVVPLLANELEPHYRKVFETGEPILEFEISGEAPSGQGTWLMSCFPVRDPTGRAVLVGTVVQDITARKAAERTVAEGRELERQLVGIASHDLRNPLNAIVMGARALAAREWPEDAQRTLKRVQASAERATRLIRDLLDLTRARLGGGLDIDLREADLRTIADQAIDELRAAHPGRELRLVHAGWTGGTFDADRLAQLIGNLVSNALRHGPAGLPITVSVSGEADLVRLEVHNQGEPIAPERIPSLFRAWERGSHGAGREGFGLGLYIVDRIADAHGGRVEVRSSAEEGTTFAVILPRHARLP
jgi:PAS domain S-box-containing protein